MLSRWRHIRLFLPKLLQTISFGATVAGKPVVEGLDFLKSLEGTRKMDLPEVPESVITSQTWWRLIVTEHGTFNRKAYTFCVIESPNFQVYQGQEIVSREFFLPGWDSPAVNNWHEWQLTLVKRYSDRLSSTNQLFDEMFSKCFDMQQAKHNTNYNQLFYVASQLSIKFWK
ncbi:hypothetical protein [Okeania sp. SIO2B3]|uniref:hypothetical protein n=1 Tax=Okeania sp. SIO2B3 TaxID=2607784 RepID=UPI0013C124BF|nr:hypothetical protein [Okeania sp. SIO2B3]NET46126.1 hypothetical protein [Okeania sp. SIO2B3]